MSKKQIFNRCPQCSGSGIENISVPLEGGGSEVQEVSCRRCLGEGKFEHSVLANSLINMLEDMRDKIDLIKEKVDLLS